jgi:hypothetical protein
MRGKTTKNSEAGNPPSSNGKRIPRSPDPMPGEESEIEIRPFYPLEDSPEARAKELELRAYLEAQAKKKS